MSDNRWDLFYRTLVAVLLAVAVAPSVSAQGNANDIRWSPSFGFNGVDDRIRSVALFGDLVVVGGDFTAAGSVDAHHVAVWDAAKERWDSLGAGFDGAVYALAVAGDQLYAGGEFTRSGSTTLNHIARWNTTAQRWEAVGGGTVEGVDGTVRTIALSGDTILIGGDFTNAGESAANRIARLDRGTNSWMPIGGGVTAIVGDARVEAIAIHRGEVFVGGRFDSAGGVFAPNVARIEGGQWKSLGTGIENGSEGPVHTFAFDDSSVYVGGTFGRVGTVEVVGVARWRPTTGTWSGLIRPTEGLRGSARSVALANGRIYVGGIIDGAGFIEAHGIVSLVNGAWRALDTGVAGDVEAIIPVSGGGLLVAGSFTRAGGVAAGRIALWDGTSWSALSGKDGRGGGVNGTVRALAIEPVARLVYVAGTFDAVGDRTVQNIAEWDESAREWGRTIGGVVGTVNAMAVGNGYLYVGGSFGSVDTVPANNIARMNLTTGVWEAFGTGLDNGVTGTVRAIALQGAEIVVGGEFTIDRGGVSAKNIAAWNITTRSWDALGTGTNAITRALAFDGRYLYAGGDFTTVNDMPANYIARFATTTRTWENLGAGTGDIVRALAAANGSVIVGGDFRTAGTVSAQGVARFESVVGYWERFGEGIDGTNPTVTSVAVGYDSVIYVTGAFETAGTGPARNVARWSPRERSWYALGNGIDGIGSNERGLAIASNLGTLYVGGNILRAGDKYSRGVAAYDAGSLAAPIDREAPSNGLQFQLTENFLPFNARIAPQPIVARP
jgi:hypothetical protein